MKINLNIVRSAIKSFIGMVASEEQAAFLSYLNKSEQELIEKAPPFYRPLSDETISEQLSQIHPSWISPFLRTFTESEIALFLAALNSDQVEWIKKEFLYSQIVPTISSLAMAYIQKTIMEYLTKEDKEITPLSLIPQSPMNLLFECNKKILHKSLDFLGLYDLSVGIRSILDKRILSKIYDSLYPEELIYLNERTHNREMVIFSSKITRDYSSDQIRSSIRKHGLNRLAKAIYGQSSSFIWHLLRRFEMKDGSSIQKLSSPLENRKALPFLIEQVLEFVKYANRHEQAILSH